VVDPRSRVESKEKYDSADGRGMKTGLSHSGHEAAPTSKNLTGMADSKLGYILNIPRIQFK
jgi:hypothetical protein